MNVSITRKNRKFFFRMFDSRLSYRQIKDKYRWQAIKRLETDVQQDDILVIKELVEKYQGFFGKIIRVKGMRFIIIYFNKEEDLTKAIDESVKTHDAEFGLWIKKEVDYIDENGELKEHDGRVRNQYKSSKSSSYKEEWEQQSGPSRRPAPSRLHKQWR